MFSISTNKTEPGIQDSPKRIEASFLSAPEMMSWHRKLYYGIAICAPQGDSEAFFVYDDLSFGTDFRTVGIKLAIGCEVAIPEWEQKYSAELQKLGFSPETAVACLAVAKRNVLGDFDRTFDNAENPTVTSAYQKLRVLQVLLANPELSHIVQNEYGCQLILSQLTTSLDNAQVPRSNSALATFICSNNKILIDFDRSFFNNQTFNDPFLIIYEELYHLLDVGHQAQAPNRWRYSQDLSLDYMQDSILPLEKLQEVLGLIIRKDPASQAPQYQDERACIQSMYDQLGQIRPDYDRVQKVRQIRLALTYVKSSFEAVNESLSGDKVSPDEREFHAKVECFARLAASIDCFGDMLKTKDRRSFFKVFEPIEAYLTAKGVVTQSQSASPFHMVAFVKEAILSSFEKKFPDYDINLAWGVISKCLDELDIRRSPIK